MNGPDLRRIQAIYFDALERAPDDRAAFVAQACAGDAALEAEVHSMLASHDDAGAFLDRPLLEEFDGALAPEPLPPRLGRYRIGPLLGAGGMGRVFRARDESLDRDIAIKVIQHGPEQDEAAWQRVEHEARLLAALNHPSIATVHSLEEEEGIRFFSMEYLAGPTLDEALRSGGLEDAIAVSRSVSAALEAAHASGVLHLDLKPGNIQSTDHGAWKVLDFGIGRLGRDEEDDARGFCTPGYAAPEQLRGESLDERSDLFSLGCVLFECLTGKQAFPGSARGEEPDWDALAGRCSPALESTLRALLERRPARRPKDAATVRRVLDAEHLRQELQAMQATPPELQPTHHNLPEPRGRFVGRAELLAEVHAALDAARLVTLTGMPGCGKSRTALEVARTSVPRYADGVWFVDLTRVRDGEGVVEAVAKVFGMRERGEQGLTRQLAGRLEEQDLLLVLDNCEHVLDA
ncbi:MAG: protein kinase, partial [Planctomycetota bacterium]